MHAVSLQAQTFVGCKMLVNTPPSTYVVNVDIGYFEMRQRILLQKDP